MRVPAQLAAIKRLGMGSENKVVLHFAVAFWRTAKLSSPYFQVTDQRFRFLSMEEFDKRGLLIVHVCPPFSRGYDGLTDEQVVVGMSLCMCTRMSGYAHVYVHGYTHANAHVYTRSIHMSMHVPEQVVDEIVGVLRKMFSAEMQSSGCRCACRYAYLHTCLLCPLHTCLCACVLWHVVHAACPHTQLPRRVHRDTLGCRPICTRLLFVLRPRRTRRPGAIG